MDFRTLCRKLCSIRMSSSEDMNDYVTQVQKHLHPNVLILTELMKVCEISVFCNILNLENLIKSYGSKFLYVIGLNRWGFEGRGLWGYFTYMIEFICVQRIIQATNEVLYGCNLGKGWLKWREGFSEDRELHYDWVYFQRVSYTGNQQNDVWWKSCVPHKRMTLCPTCMRDMITSMCTKHLFIVTMGT